MAPRLGHIEDPVENDAPPRREDVPDHRDAICGQAAAAAGPAIARWSSLSDMGRAYLSDAFRSGVLVET